MTHRAVTRSLRSAAACVAIVGLAACDDATGPSGDRLRPEDVSAIYAVCELTFDPTGTTLPTVNILEAAFELPPGGMQPTIGLDPNPQTLELTYVPKGQVNDRELRGTYALRNGTRVEIRFNASGVDPKPLLIPENRGLDFEFEESPMRLLLAASSQYNVPRSDYVALSGADPAGLADQIPGVLVADFRQGGCSS